MIPPPPSQRYIQSPPQEGFVLTSANVLTEADPGKVVWSLLPDGDHGAPSPAGFSPNTTVAEEWHVLPLGQQASSPGFYAIFRTNLGVLGATSTGDPTAASGWQPSAYAAYDLATPLPGGPPNASLSLKNPRGPVQLKRFSNGQTLLLFYNNHNGGFASRPEAANSICSRNPYWLTAGRDAGNNTVVFAQPEIVLYIRDQSTSKGPG